MLSQEELQKDFCYGDGGYRNGNPDLKAHLEIQSISKGQQSGQSHAADKIAWCPRGNAQVGV
jgi:hypothetical protein